MTAGQRRYSVTDRQREIWLSQEVGRSGAQWQLSFFVRVDGGVDRVILQRAIRVGLAEAEACRAVFFEAGGQLFQTVIDGPDGELVFHDLRSAADPVREAYRLAEVIQRTPMPFTAPLYRWALFQTGSEEFYWFACCHHICVDGLSIALVGRRIAAIYTAMVSGAPMGGAFFGSLQDLLDFEADYEASAQYLDDRAYWEQNLPTDGGSFDQVPIGGFAQADADLPAEPVALDPLVIGGVKSISKEAGVRRSSVIIAATALLVSRFSGDPAQVVLSLPVSRRVGPGSAALTGMLAGVVPLVVSASPESSVTQFCQGVDHRIRQAQAHQRFPVNRLEGHGGQAGLGPQAPRVLVNVLPGRTRMDFGGVPATLIYSTFGPVGHFGIFFVGAGDHLTFTTAGAGKPFADFAATELAHRFQRVLAAMRKSVV